MGKKVILKFDYMEKDNINSSVTVYSDKSIECTDFVRENHRKVFGKCLKTMEYLYKFFERRCFPRNNFAVKELLTQLGLTQYNPYDIVKITRGHMTCDCNWIRFNDESLTWADIDSGNYTKWNGSSTIDQESSRGIK